MKKILSLVLAMLMILSTFPLSTFAEKIEETLGSDVIASGFCGGDTDTEYDEDSGAYKNLWWTLDSEGTLTIDGEGPMKNFNSFSMPWYNFCASIKRLAIENGVTSIGDFAFGGYGLTGDLVIPDSVTTIGMAAFSGCSNFDGQLILGNGVTNIGNSAFHDCFGFSGKLIIPKSVKNIESAAFSHCYGFTGNLVIPDSVTNIGEYAFSLCYGFSGDLVIPEGVTNIGGHAFFATSFERICFKGDAPTVEKATNDLPSFDLDVTLYYFEGKTGWATPVWNGYQTKAIVDFGYCGSDTNAEWDEESGAYKNLWWTLDSEGTLTIGGEGPMMDYLHTEDSMKHFYVTSAPWGHYIDQLKTLVIEDGVTSIGKCAFDCCSGFSGELIIPNSVTSIGGGAFQSCRGFTGNLVIPNSVTSIDGSAFFRCNGFTGDLVIPNSITRIESLTFFGCDGFTGNLVIPNSVTSIGQSAFQGYLGNIYFSGDAPEATEETNKAPSFESDVTLYYIDGKTGWTSPTWNGYNTAVWDGKTVVASGYCGGDETAKWDEESGAYKNLIWTLDSEGVLTISGRGKMKTYNLDSRTPWEKYKDQLKSLVIEDGITSIGSWAFFNFSCLTGNLVIPDSVISIEDGAFSFCYGFTGNLVIPDNVTSIGAQAFGVCYGFTGDLILPDSVTSIGHNAFSACYGITGKLVIPSEIKIIEDHTFEASGFTGELIIPNGVTNIGNSAFENCRGFTGELIIPNSVVSIGENAFWCCSGFNGDLVIPENVASISDYAFWGTLFNNVYFKGNAPSVASANADSPSFEPDVTLYYIEGKSGWTSPTWNGYKTEIYDPDSEAKKWLRERGFYNYWDENTEIITDFENDDLSLEVVFGENDDFGDKITAEFIDDILTITVHDVSAEQWKKAYLPGTKMYCAHIYWSFPETVLADQFCGHAYFEKWIKDDISDSENFIYSRNWGNGDLIANFFLCNDQVSVVPQNLYNGNHYLIIACVEDGEINYKVLVFRVIVADDAKAVTFDDPYKGGFVPMSRMEIHAASEKMQPLTEEYENGTLVFSYNGGKTTVEEIVSDLNIRDLYWTSNHFIVSAPEGYVLEKIMRDDYRWSEVEENAVSVELDFPFGEDGNIWTADMTYTIAWRNKDDGRIIHETLTVRNDFGKKFNPLDVYWDPVPAERVAYYSWDEDVYLTEKDLEVYGILTDYSEETGCVRTRFSEDPDLLSLGECLAVVTPPEGAVYYRCNHSSGSMGRTYRKEDAEEQKWYIENFDYELVSDMRDWRVNVIVSQGCTVEVNGKKYVYQRAADEEIYRCVVEWYDENKNLIAGEYLYDIVDPYFEEMKVKTFSGFCGGDETAEYDEGSDARKNLWWEIDENGVLTIGGKGPMKDYEWTSKANGVWSLTAPWAKYSFMITDLVIEDGITKIGEESFDGMEQLKGTLDLPDSIEEIGPYAFAYTGFSGELKLPKNLEVIDIAAFEGVHCSGNLVIPSGVKKIYVHAFEKGNYESVFIPNTVDEIIAPFPYCYDLRNIEFEDGSIYCFENGAVLDAETKSMLFEYLPIGYLNTSIAIPETVTWIKGWAFGGCYLPNNFVIPETVEKIGPNAFRNTVTDFYFLGDAPEMDEYTFYNEDPVLYENVTLHYISTKSGWENISYYNREIWNTAKIGDVNDDGDINVIDANIVRRASAKLITLNDSQKLAADVNNDNVINVIDANLIRRYAAKLITEFSA